MKMNVDDNLMADIQFFIEDAIVASIASNFEVLVPPQTAIRRVSLADDKFRKTALSSLRPQLRLLIDTRVLTVGIIPDKRANLIKLLSQFGQHRHSFYRAAFQY